MRNFERTIAAQVVVPATLDQVWQAWTTEEGIRTFFAPQGHVELRPGGPYEMYFDPAAEPGSRGGEGNQVLALEPGRMLSFTWNAPPHLAGVREQRTHVVVRFEAFGDATTRVLLQHDGWGEGADWDEAYEYFSRAWARVVLPRLKHRFAVGPVDWQQPPDLSPYW